MLRPFLICAAGLSLAFATFAEPGPVPYTLSKSVPLGSPDRWDYVVYDAGRVYVAHGDKVAVIDAKSGDIIGQVQDIPGGTHGTAIVGPWGFTDDGKAGVAVAFDRKTLKIAKTIVADKDADAIVADRSTGHVFVIEGDPAAITVIDAKSLAPIATIKVGEKLEYAASDGDGTVYVAGEEKKDVVKIDARTNQVVAHWSTPDCTSPHGLAYDPSAKRLFMGCINAKLMVVDVQDGKVVADLPIGRGNDAVAFDPIRKRVFSSNGLDGTISVYQQVSADKYEPLTTVTTAVSGRTMAVDPSSGRLFVAAADTDPPSTPGGRAHPKPGTLRLMMLDPVR